MKRKTIFILFFIPLFGCVSEKPEMQNFEWIYGKWEMKTDSAIFTETWEKNGEFLEGSGILTFGNDTLFKEILRIEKIGKHWVYIASAGNSAPVLFTLVDSLNGKWLFENKEHDYPQQIQYELINPQHLTAKTMGFVGEKSIVEEYPMKKQN